MLDAARALRPALAARARDAEAAGDIPAETIAAFRAAGLIRILQPPRFGGHGGPFALFSAVAETLAEGCAAAAWVYAVFGEHTWIVANFPALAQDDVWGENPDALVCASLIPRNVAAPAPGGWRVSGTFPFASGSAHADWAILGVAADGVPLYLLAPMAALTRADDWQVLGLRATGSASLIARDLFVPEHRAVRLADLLAGTAPGRDAHPDYQLLRAPRYLLVPYSLPSVAIGLGTRAVAEAVALLRHRRARGTVALADSEWVQVELGRAAGEIAAARALLHTGRDAAEAAIAGPVTAFMLAAHRRDMALAVDLVRTGIERLCDLAGTELVRDAGPLQPLLRDALTIATHGVVSVREAMGEAGRAMLGSGD